MPSGEVRHLHAGPTGYISLPKSRKRSGPGTFLVVPSASTPAWLGDILLLELLAQFGYLAILGLLVAGGLGAPVPEELVQLTAGYLARSGPLSLGPAIAVAWGGILTGDFLLYRLGRRHGPGLLDTPRIARLLTPRRRALIDRHFKRHAILTIALARHASGLRLPVFALAGASGVSARTFLIADGASALVSVPLVVGAGFFFASHIDLVKRRLHEVELFLLLAVILVGAVWALTGWFRVRRAARRGPPTKP
jgi:membrane protein DedA with SNARE-associated domain